MCESLIVPKLECVSLKNGSKVYKSLRKFIKVQHYLHMQKNWKFENSSPFFSIAVFVIIIDRAFRFMRDHSTFINMQ